MKLSNLPRELEEEILFRVPVKSLRLVRATGKKWYHHPLFKDPSFIKRHSDKAPARKYHEAIVLHDFGIETMSSYAIMKSHFISFFSSIPWIQPRNDGMKSDKIYALGYDNKELCRSYKILRSLEDQTVEIYEFKSDSWRTLDGVSPGGSFESLGVSLKGNAYWISRKGGAKEYTLLEFDFSTEKFQHHYLPFHEADCLGPYVLKEALNNLALSVVKEDRLCLFYESSTKEQTEIWMSSVIGGETASVSWSKYLADDATPFYTRHVSFYVDEEEKLATCFYNHERHMMCLAKEIDILNHEEDLTLTQSYLEIRKIGTTVTVEEEEEERSLCFIHLLLSLRSSNVE
ncbi:unnamed protein product [Microthlaspi erraticum]|uniref:F-box domain-containing protein n=1 Tax=Microthlaspi erraticum TaxID=1685480 RepID=A0A6D2K5U3_9BRAS|nr:unnamed protein product [Microthlaspi erraticum]